MPARRSLGVGGWDVDSQKGYANSLVYKGEKSLSENRGDG